MSAPVPEPVAPATTVPDLLALDGNSPTPVPRPAESAARLLSSEQLGGEALDTDVLGQIAAGLAASVGHSHAVDHGEIERVRVLATEGYDAWVMIWGPGATMAEHDHDGSIGVLHVIDGELTETVVTPDGDELRRLPAGRSTEFAATHRHALANPSMVTARSVNVYSPPLGSAAGD